MAVGDKVSFRARAGDLFTYFGIGREKTKSARMTT